MGPGEIRKPRDLLLWADEVRRLPAQRNSSAEPLYLAARFGSEWHLAWYWAFARPTRLGVESPGWPSVEALMADIAAGYDRPDPLHPAYAALRADPGR